MVETNLEFAYDACAFEPMMHVLLTRVKLGSSVICDIMHLSTQPKLFNAQVDRKGRWKYTHANGWSVGIIRPFAATHVI